MSKYVSEFDIKDNNTYNFGNNVPINLIPEDDRLAYKPIGRPELLRHYDNQQHGHWVASEIHLTNDYRDMGTIDIGEQRLIKWQSALFAQFDMIVNCDFVKKYLNVVKIPEAQYFYGAQLNMENVHAETYADIAETIMPLERDVVFNAIANMPILRELSEWINARSTFDVHPDAVHRDEYGRFLYSQSLYAAILVEGIMFQTMFIIPFWFQRYNKFAGIIQANQFISRDERYHSDFSIEMYNLIEPFYKLPRSVIVEMTTEFMAILNKFMVDMLPNQVRDLNAGVFMAHAQYLADKLLGDIKQDPMYGVTITPFPDLVKLSLPNKHNFFERQVTSYTKRSAVDEGDDGGFYHDC